MKKMVLIFAAMLTMSAGTAFAQNYMVVNSETIFRSIDEYNKALEQIETEAQNYQTQIDEAFNQLEATFNDFQNRRASMSAADRQQTEQRIIARENEITQFQADIFGNEGTIMQKRIELIRPIQDRVFNAISQYAQQKGYDIVIDLASNPTILFYSPAVNQTDAIIALLK